LNFEQGVLKPLLANTALLFELVKRSYNPILDGMVIPGINVPMFRCHSTTLCQTLLYHYLPQIVQAPESRLPLPFHLKQHSKEFSPVSRDNKKAVLVSLLERLFQGSSEKDPMPLGELSQQLATILSSFAIKTT